MTCAPAPASASAMERPNQPVAPDRKATLPSRPNSDFVSAPSDGAPGIVHTPLGWVQKVLGRHRQSALQFLVLSSSQSRQTKQVQILLQLFQRLATDHDAADPRQSPD